MDSGLSPIFAAEEYIKIPFRPPFDTSSTSLGFLWKRIWGSEKNPYYSTDGGPRHPETRKEEINDTLRWIRTPSSSSTPVLWIQGAAGVGKSVIAQELFTECVGKELLSSFFFSSSHPTTNTPAYFVRAILYSLVRLRPELRQPVSRLLDSNPAIWEASLEEQFETLIIGAFQSASFVQRFHLAQGKKKPDLIMIYGLDEMDEAHRIFGIALSNLNKARLPLRLIVFSQPDSSFASSLDVHALRRLTSPMTINPKNTDRDIRTYLNSRFLEIRSGHTHNTELFGDLWPSHADFEVVIQNAQSRFIYAHMLIEVVNDDDGAILRHPSFLLTDILDETRAKAGHLSPLDCLFRYILLKAGEECPNSEELVAILSSILLFRFTNGAASPLFIELLWNFSSDLSQSPAYFRAQIRAACYLVAYNGQNDIDIHFNHPSIVDFLRDPVRAGPFYIDELQSYHALVHRWLQKLVQSHANMEQGFNRPATKTLWEQWATFITSFREPDEIVISCLLALDLSALFNRALSIWLVGFRPFHLLFRNLRIVADWLELCDLPDAERLRRRFTIAQQAIHVRASIPPALKNDIMAWLIFDLGSCKYACGSTKRVQDSIRANASSIKFVVVGEDCSCSSDSPDKNLLHLQVQDGYITILDMFLDELSNINPRRMESRDLARALIFNVLGSSLLSLCGPNRDLLPRCHQTIEFSKKIRGRFQYDRSGIVAEEYVECRITTLRWLKSFNSDEDRQIRELVRALKNFVPEEPWWHKLLMLLLRW
ncbi:hypothetical protein PQX77_002716 [Marasmius sp. AFHP31]|nr:hypothetical protein PQX77_002716 [Marasmius sp. AFHP31]